MSTLLLGGSGWDLDMGMQDPECWVSITRGCRVTALYLCPPSPGHHYLTRKDRLIVTPPVGGGGGGRSFLYSAYLHLMTASIHPIPPKREPPR